MRKLYELKEKLCEELKQYEGKNTFSSQDLERIDDLSDIVKNLGKIIKMYGEEEYSNAYSGMYSTYGRSYARDNRGRYSRDYSNEYSRDTATEHLEKMLREEPDDHKRREIQAMIDKLNRM